MKKFCIIYGSFDEESFYNSHVVGPFDSIDTAKEYAETDELEPSTDYEIVELKPPEVKK